MIQCHYCKRREGLIIFFNSAEEYIEHLKVCKNWTYELKHPNEGRVKRNLSQGRGVAGEEAGKIRVNEHPPARSPKASFLTSLIMCVKCFIHNRQHCGK
jgi:hypothetical protein